MPQESVLKDNKIHRSFFKKIVISHIEKLLWPLASRVAYSGNLKFICVELSSVCNANCVFCTYQFFPENREKKFMHEDIFKKVIQEVKTSNIQEVMLSPDLGEPTLAPGIIEKVSAFRKAGVRKIELTTNAITLHRIGIDTFLEKGPDVINISTAGFDAEMFRRIYRCQGYETMRKNVFELLKENSRRTTPREINIWLRIDIPVKEAMALPGMAIVTSLASDVGWLTEVDSWNGRINQDMLPGTMRLQTKKETLTLRPCRTLLSTVIRVDGGVHACSCRNIANDPDLFLGNIMDEGILSCYKKLSHIITRWKNGKFPAICKSCDMYSDPRDRVVGYIMRRIKSLSH